MCDESGQKEMKILSASLCFHVKRNLEQLEQIREKTGGESSIISFIIYYTFF